MRYTFVAMVIVLTIILGLSACFVDDRPYRLNDGPYDYCLESSMENPSCDQEYTWYVGYWSTYGVYHPAHYLRRPGYLYQGYPHYWRRGRHY